ncbi:glycosyltransferase family 2 protein [Flavobacterium sp.]|uniref:glycosyltransferase family 2 protein n=1 Tax=Flavobacterium sp. TaxID=239 RepID=UPI00375137B0
MKPYFSVIIPLYNKENFIKNTIKSVLNQSFTDFELIIVNDCSTDRSLNIVSKFIDERLKIFSKKNEGVAIARNFGIENSKGDFICFLDADDIWKVDYLKIMNFYSIKFPELKVFSCAIEIETNTTLFKPNYSIKKTNDYEIVDFFNASNEECVLWTSSIVINKNVFQKIGTFDIKINKGEDTELWIRIGLNYSILFIWEVLSTYKYDLKSISRNSNYYFEDYVFKKYIEEEKRNPALKKYLDLNRFSAAIKCKLNNNLIQFKKLKSEIDLKEISFKKKILLYLPRFILLVLIFFKNKFVEFGLTNSIFK